ncbi:MAG: dienelactone hydrolase family protein [Thiohalocapsa sp.]|nr:dienelactone hydrolase family protein [Thiohalocapsa sp.]MCF7991632.1 dienelactone hydrolase family protein [Thiohalocapsa sp.]
MFSQSTESIIEVQVQAHGTTLAGTLTMPEDARGLVAFAHGSGSSRFSSRNRYVAGILQQAGLATLLFDLLTAEEDEVDQRTRALRFDIDLLGERMTGAVDWLQTRESTRRLSLGLFGASTGAAAALTTASVRPEQVAAVVSRGGRPDLAMSALPAVRCPTLLIVGANDSLVIDMNRSAAEHLTAEHALVLVPGATHLFEEPGTLDKAAAHARDWFLKYLVDHEH